MPVCTHEWKGQGETLASFSISLQHFLFKFSEILFIFTCMGLRQVLSLNLEPAASTSLTRQSPRQLLVSAITDLGLQVHVNMPGTLSRPMTHHGVTELGPLFRPKPHHGVTDFSLPHGPPLGSWVRTPLQAPHWVAGLGFPPLWKLRPSSCDLVWEDVSSSISASPFPAGIRRSGLDTPAYFPSGREDHLLDPGI